MSGGKLTASLVPVEPANIGATLADLREIMRTLPHLDFSDKAFEADVMAASNLQPSMPKALSWE